MKLDTQKSAVLSVFLVIMCIITIISSQDKEQRSCAMIDGRGQGACITAESIVWGRKLIFRQSLVTFSVNTSLLKN
jgi:hypothetical protein